MNLYPKYCGDCGTILRKINSTNTSATNMYCDKCKSYPTKIITLI